MATEKTILSIDLYDNVLTEAPGDYTGKVNITGTVRMILGLAGQRKIKAILSCKSVVDGHAP